MRVITVRIRCPEALTPAVLAALEGNPALSSLVVARGASRTPIGDVIEADVPREAANPIVDELMALGVQDEGTIALIPVATWVSRRALAAEQAVPGLGSDAVVWTEVIERAYEESALSWTYVSFMILATLLAAIAVVTDSVILIIGAMVLGPEFVPIAALGLGLVRRRFTLLRTAVRTLVVGFAVSITSVAVLAAIGRAAGFITVDEVIPESRPSTSFIYSPSAWSLIIAIIAGSAGVLALTSAKSGGLVGVFISVTTIPASGNIAVALVFGLWAEVWGSTLTLVVNVIGMALAGWLTLALQQAVWRGQSRRRVRSGDRE